MRNIPFAPSWFFVAFLAFCAILAGEEAQVDAQALLQENQALSRRREEVVQKEAASREAQEVRRRELQERIRERESEVAGLEERLRSLEAEIAGLRRRRQEVQGACREAESLLLPLHSGEGEPPWQELLPRRREEVARMRRALPEAGMVVTPEGLPVEGLLLRFGDLCYFAGTGEAGVAFAEKGRDGLRLLRLPPEGQERICQRMAAPEGSALPMPVSLSGPEGFLPASPPPRQSLWSHFRQGGAVMVPLGVLAWLCLAVLLERILFFARHGRRREAQRLREALRALPEGEEGRRVEVARGFLEQAKRGLSLLAVSASVAPLLGLLGTVTGMIRAFQQITLHGTGDPRLLAGGISEALVTTEAGLLVAIPAMLFHAWCVRRNRRLAAALEQVLASKGE